MKRPKTDRDNLIIKMIKSGQYKIDVASAFNLSPSMITKIWKKYQQQVKDK